MRIAELLKDALLAAAIALSVGAHASTLNPSNLTAVQVGTIDGSLSIVANGGPALFAGIFTAGDSNAQGGYANTKADDWLLTLGGTSGDTTAAEIGFSTKSGNWGLGLYQLNTLGSYDLITEATSNGFATFLSLSADLLAGTYLLHISGPNGLVDGYAGAVSAVPLPGAALLFGSALLGAGALRRKQTATKKVAALA